MIAGLGFLKAATAAGILTAAAGLAGKAVKLLVGTLAFFAKPAVILAGIAAASSKHLFRFDLAYWVFSAIHHL